MSRRGSVRYTPHAYDLFYQCRWGQMNQVQSASLALYSERSNNADNLTNLTNPRRSHSRQQMTPKQPRIQTTTSITQ